MALATAPPTPAVDFVENHRRRAARFGKRDLECQDEARQLAARSDAGKRAERRTGIGRNFEFDAVHAGRPGLGRSDGRTKAGGVELQRREFGSDRGVEARSGFAALAPRASAAAA